MLKKSRVLLYLAMCVLIIGGQVRAKQSGPIRTIWIDSATINLTDHDYFSAVLAQPVSRVVVACFEGGKTIFPTTSRLFTQMPQYIGKPDPLIALIRHEHTVNRRVYAFVDCLHWRKPGLFAGDDLFKDHPELAERNMYGGCGVAADGKYASPLNHNVEKNLISMVAELHVRYPTLDGLILQCRLAPHSPMGYSDDTRVQYILAKQIDPIDVSFDVTSDGFQSARDFEQWRMMRMQQLVEALSNAWHGKKGAGIVATTGYADWNELYWTQRCTTLENWQRWYKAKIINHIFVDQPYDTATFAMSSGKTAEQIGTLTVHGTSVDILIPLSNGYTALDPLAEIETLQDIPASGITLVANRPEDLAVAERFWSIILPSLAPALRSAMN